MIAALLPYLLDAEGRKSFQGGARSMRNSMRGHTGVGGREFGGRGREGGFKQR